jgi:2-haloacid dehalogenase
LAAARKCGLATAFVLRPHEHGADQATDLKAEQDWGAIATSFEDLADQLGC